MTVESAYRYLFVGALIAIGVFLALVIVKSIIGPRISDRLVTVNAVSTLVISAILILSVMLTKEEYLIDVALIYVLISFLSVVVFDHVFINTYLAKKRSNTRRDKEENR